jgi:hypothetical protein
MEEGSGKRLKIFLSDFHGSKKANERHIQFKSDGVPIDDNASKFMNYFTILVRERVPCTIQSWKKVNVGPNHKLVNILFIH